MKLVLAPLRRETLRIGHGKTLVLLSLLLIFILLGIVAGILFDRLSALSLKEGATTCLVLLQIKISGPLPKTSLTTFVNLPFLPLFALTVLLLTLLLKRPISSASFFSSNSTLDDSGIPPPTPSPVSYTHLRAHETPEHL